MRLRLRSIREIRMDQWGDGVMTYCIAKGGSEVFLGSKPLLPPVAGEACFRFDVVLDRIELPLNF